MPESQLVLKFAQVVAVSLPACSLRLKNECRVPGRGNHQAPSCRDGRTRSLCAKMQLITVPGSRDDTRRSAQTGWSGCPQRQYRAAAQADSGGSSPVTHSAYEGVTRPDAIWAMTVVHAVKPERSGM